ncbi:MAG: hypothetical protein M0R80_04380 [Proteobacteria bacterium]|jgi:hypothetical protein|nr:hypothetical protein [Pseudomonadota bacterium]
MTQEEAQKEIKVVTLQDGTTINQWCMSQFDNLTLNQEVLWDILNVFTNLIHFNLTRNGEGLITDVILVLPKITEEVTSFALKNFMEHQKLREDSISEEAVMELRRLKLQKHIKEMINQ